MRVEEGRMEVGWRWVEDGWRIGGGGWGRVEDDIGWVEEGE